MVDSLSLAPNVPQRAGSCKRIFIKRENGRPREVHPAEYPGNRSRNPVIRFIPSRVAKCSRVHPLFGTLLVCVAPLRRRKTALDTCASRNFSSPRSLQIPSNLKDHQGCLLFYYVQKNLKQFARKSAVYELIFPIV